MGREIIWFDDRKTRMAQATIMSLPMFIWPSGPPVPLWTASDQLVVVVVKWCVRDGDTKHAFPLAPIVIHEVSDLTDERAHWLLETA